MMTTGHPTPSSAAAHEDAPARRPLELLEARRQRDTLKSLLRAEQAAMADFLVALADFDRRRGWEVLGHASLFAFLNSELGLSPAPTYWRQEAARLLQRFPDLVEPLRRGRLCLTTMVELAKVLTVENKQSLLPRFLGLSSREAKEIVAELQPREAPPTRTVVTRLPGGEVETSPAQPSLVATSTAALPATIPTGVPPSQLWAPKVEFGGVVGTVTRRDEVEALSVDRSRIHVSVSRQFTQKLDAARRGLGHSIPNATIEKVLEAALDLLLEKQARARAQVKRPRATVSAKVAPRAEEQGVATSAQRSIATAPGITSIQPQDTPLSLALTPTEPPPPRRTGPREAIPAAVRRAVWARDGGRCAWPLDAGSCCGSTHRLELDHIVPWARGGGSTVENLRLACRVHNAAAARQAFGARVAGRHGGRRAGGGG